MEWLIQLEKAIAYMENHLDSEILPEEAARITDIVGGLLLGSALIMFYFATVKQLSTKQ